MPLTGAFHGRASRKEKNISVKTSPHSTMIRFCWISSNLFVKFASIQARQSLCAKFANARAEKNEIDNAGKE
jgi:hypothetical protein